MNYTHIDIEGDTYTLTQTPNWLQKLFGYKPRKIEYIDAGYVYYYFDHLTCFMNKATGESLSVTSTECEILNNRKKKLEWTK